MEDCWKLETFQDTGHCLGGLKTFQDNNSQKLHTVWEQQFDFSWEKWQNLTTSVSQVAEVRIVETYGLSLTWRSHRWWWWWDFVTWWLVFRKVTPILEAEAVASRHVLSLICRPRTNQIAFTKYLICWLWECQGLQDARFWSRYLNLGELTD